MQVIYVDVLFFMNFAADYMILYLTKLVLRREIRRKRILLASFLGAIYAVFATLYLLSALTILLSATGVLLLMVLLTFGYGGTLRLVRTFLASALVAALLGGLIGLLWSFLYRFFGSHTVNADTGWKLLAFLLLCGVGYLSVALANRLSGVGRESTVNASITVRGVRRNAVLLADNACFLREPLTGRAVVILSVRTATGLLPSALLSAREGELPMLSGEDRRRYYAIPYHTVAGKRLMHGFRPDEVEIIYHGRKKRVAVLIGIGDAAIDRFRGCDGIVPSGILE